MRILAIETSCDETAVCILQGSGRLVHPKFKVLGSTLLSQIKIHTHWGGVVPNLAKREHSKSLIPLLTTTLREAKLEKKAKMQPFSPSIERKVKKILAREPELCEAFLEYVPTFAKPNIDAIAVTRGPGLEPALWVGINFAKALSLVWGIPVMPINHMEGHIVSVLREGMLKFPAVSLLISGGHTELVYMPRWFEYKLIGATRDDAVGEAFDKVARMLNLPYPGGPQISKLAEEARSKKEKRTIELPRPMIGSDNFDFSFSGLKTAVLYTIKKLPKLDAKTRRSIAREFEDAATEVLVAKTEKALKKYKPKSLILGGGVTANTHIRREFEKCIKMYPNTTLHVPDRLMSTDNAIMIGMAAYLRLVASKKAPKTFVAEGNLSLR